MKADELDNIRKSIKSKTAKTRKKRNSGGGRGGNASEVSKAAGRGAVTGTVDGHASPSKKTVVPPVSPNGELRGGDGAMVDGGSVREVMDERLTACADSDDEIMLPEGVPAFLNLEEAMLVRELRRDRLPGKIIRGIDDGGSTVSFVALVFVLSTFSTAFSRIFGVFVLVCSCYCCCRCSCTYSFVSCCPRFLLRVCGMPGTWSPL